MSSSRRRLAPLVTVAAAAVLAALAGCSAQAPARPHDGDRASAAPSSPEASRTPPEPDATGLTQASPDQGVTEESAAPSPTGSEPDADRADGGRADADVDDAAGPSESPATDPTAPDPTDPTDGAEAGEEQALEYLCALGEPSDWWGDADIRRMCEDEYGY